MMQVQYLSYIMDEHGMLLYPSKMKSICDKPSLTTTIELCIFLGLPNFFVLGISQISWPLIQVAKCGGKVHLFWVESQQKTSEELKHHLCPTLILYLHDLQKPFEIEIDTFDYVVGKIHTQHGHLMAYHSETLTNSICTIPPMVRRSSALYSRMDNGSITFSGRRRSSTLITSPYSSYICKETNRMTTIKIGPHIFNSSTSTLSIIKVKPTGSSISSVDHEPSRWSQLYANDLNFTTTYQILREGTLVVIYHTQDGLLYNMGHFFIPSSECVKMIWESLYS